MSNIPESLSTLKTDLLTFIVNHPSFNLLNDDRNTEALESTSDARITIADQKFSLTISIETRQPSTEEDRIEQTKQTILNSVPNLTNIDTRTKEDLTVLVKALKALTQDFKDEIADRQYN